MNDLLDLPPIEAAALAMPEPAPVQALDLRKINLTDVALAQYGDWQKDVAATKANLSTLVLDLSTPTKIKEARSLRQRLIGEPLAAVRKVAAGIKSAMATTSKAVGAELEKIEAAYSEADALILPKIEAREAELEAERAEKARIEAERVATLTAKVAMIRSYVQRAAGASAEKIAAGIKAIEAWTFPAEQWQEFAGQAAAARDETLEALRRMHAAAVQAEADRAERERLEAERERAEAARLAELQTVAAKAEQVAQEVSAAPPDFTRIPMDLVMRAASTPAHAPTVTTPDGTVADASTGEVLYRPLQDVPPPEPTSAPAPEPEPEPAASVHVDTKDDPAVKLGDLNARLGFTMTEAFVRDTLGITPRRDGRAVLIAESALPDLADKLVERIREVLGS